MKASKRLFTALWLGYALITFALLPLSLTLLFSFQIMEQVEGGDLVVNRGDESRPKATSTEKRELNAVDGLDAAFKLAQVCYFFPSHLETYSSAFRLS